MTTIVFLTAIVAIALLFWHSCRSTESFLPSGKPQPSDSELLALSKEDIKLWDYKDVCWLIDYAGHKMAEDEKEPNRWNALFLRASQVRYHY